MKTPAEILGRHVTDYFGGHQVFEVDPPEQVADRVPGLRILEVPAGKRVDVTSYLTLGCWDAVQTLGVGTEFVFTAREPDPRHVGSLAEAAIAHCGAISSRLERGSVVRLGRPWLPGSSCDHLLVTLPYPYGPELEYCRWRVRGQAQTARFLWLMPITAAEGVFVATDGIDALEARFEALEVNFADPARNSAV